MIKIIADHDPGAVAGAHRLPFYLAMEEWVARNMPKGEYITTWRVDPTVIVGRNQCTAHEVDLEYCRDHGIDVCRRRSGGGCVYADHDNIMTSLIYPSADVASTFARYTEMMAGMLRSLGFNAEATGRNDLLVDGRKVSGGAYYRLTESSIVHGTMLVDTDIDHMCRAITPARAKVLSHQVHSVESRITTLRAIDPDITVERVNDAILALADDEYTLSPGQIKQVKEIEAGYRDPRWIFGHRGVLYNAAASHRVSRRIDGVGTFDIVIETSEGVISDIDFSGDFFLLGDIDSAIIDKLRGCRPRRQHLARALEGVDICSVISGMSREDLVDLLVIDKTEINKPTK